VKFLIDARLPRRLARWLNDRGFDAIHTFDLPSGNASTDQSLIAYADLEGRFIVTKDDDFVQSYILSGVPARLWLITTGNIRNDALESLIDRHWASIHAALGTSRFVELSTIGLVVHD